MAIAFDSSTAGAGPATNGTSLSVSVTAPTGSNVLMVVGFRILRSIEPTGSATYGGVAMTKISVTETTIGSAQWVELWYLLAPASGSNTLTRTAQGLPTQSQIHAYTVAFYTGVAQSSQPNASNSGRQAGGDFTIAATSTVDNCWLIGDAHETQGSGGAGTTARSGVNSLFICDKNGPTTPAGSATLIFDEQLGGNTAANVAMFAPAVASGPANLKSLDTNLKANIKSYNTNVLANIKSINTNA